MKEKVGGLAFVAAFCGFFAVMGAMGLLDLIREVGLARESVRWPAAEGEVVDVTISRALRSTRVLYRFAVDGRVHEGRRIAFVDRARGRTRSELAAEYPEGRRLTVRYDPDDPETAVLEPGVTTGMILEDGLVTGGFLLFGLGAGIAGGMAILRG